MAYRTYIKSADKTLDVESIIAFRKSFHIISFAIYN